MTTSVSAVTRRLGTQVKKHRSALTFWLLILLVSTGLLAVHGTGFGLTADVNSWTSTRGDIACMSQSLSDALHGRCNLVGGPGGIAVGNGWPIVLAGALLVRLFSLSPDAAAMAISFVMTAAALYGAIRLLERYDVRRWLAFLMAVGYLVSPSVLGMAPFGSTFWGILLMPAFIYFWMWALDQYQGDNHKRLMLTLPILSFATFISFSLDGYSGLFVLAGVALLVLANFVKRDQRRVTSVQLVVLTVSTGIGAAAYKLFQGESAVWQKSSIDLFRAMGADVVTFVFPSSGIWWANAAPIIADHTILWGDGTNSRFNYIGVVVAVLAAIGVVLAVRKRQRALGWLLVVLVAGVFSLGPSLKINEVRGPLPEVVTYDSYLMPAEDAVMTLPTQVLYEKVPGLADLRATYRWHALTRLGLVVLAAIALERLARRDRKFVFAAAGLAVLAIAETAPNVPRMFSTYERNYNSIVGISDDVVNPLKEALPSRSLVAIAPGTSGANDFLSRYIGGYSGLVLYNTGGDKPLVEAVPRWPQSITDIIYNKPGFAENAFISLNEGHVDAIVVPYFDTRWGLGHWPPLPQHAAPGHAAMEEIEKDGRFQVEHSDYFAIVRLMPSS